MFVSFQQWPEFLKLLQQWRNAPSVSPVSANVIANFIADEKLEPEMFDAYRRVVESHLKGVATTEANSALGGMATSAMMEQWFMAHQEYFETEIRVPDSRAFRQARMASYFSPNKWLLWLRRANVLRPGNLELVKKKITDELERLESRSDDDAKLAMANQDLHDINKAIELKISTGSLEKLYNEQQTVSTNGQDIQTVINALNIHATYDDRNGQPIYVGFVDDFPEVLRVPESKDSVSVIEGRERDVGTVIRDRLGISHYKEDDSVVLFCYRSPDFPSLNLRLAAPTVLDTTASNQWFFPTPVHYGRLGHSVCMIGQCPPPLRNHPSPKESGTEFVLVGRKNPKSAKHQ